jgi:hypothetical protein
MRGAHSPEKSTWADAGTAEHAITRKKTAETAERTGFINDLMGR